MDLLCTDDVDEFGTEIDDPLQELEQDVFHMLLETYGSNPDAPSRGVGVQAALSGPLTIHRSREIESRLTVDDRITAARATITPLEAVGEYRLDLLLQVNEQELGLTFVTDAAGNLRRSA